MKTLLAPLFAAIAFLTLSVAAYAYEVGPMRFVLSPSNGKTSGTFAVRNTRSEDLAFEIQSFRREVAQDGTQSLVPVDGLFSVFPLQASVAPDSSQSVRFRYVGPPIRDKSQSYVLQVTEVPAGDLEETGVRFTYNFGVAIYVDGPDPAARLDVVEAVAVNDMLQLSVHNVGNGYGFTTGLELEYRLADGSEVTLGADEISAMIDNPLVPPQSVRTFDLPIDLADKSVMSARFKLPR